MAVNFSVALRNARATAARDACAGGDVQILDASEAVISTHELTGTGGTISDGVWTLAFESATVAATASGIATSARIRTSSGADAVTGLTVGDESSGADFKLQNVNINAGQEITLTAATISET